MRCHSCNHKLDFKAVQIAIFKKSIDCNNCGAELKAYAKRDKKFVLVVYLSLVFSAYAGTYFLETQVGEYAAIFIGAAAGCLAWVIAEYCIDL